MKEVKLEPNNSKQKVMDTQSFTKYELVHFASDKRFVTEYREEAETYFKEGWIVTEHSTTIGKITSFASTRLTMSVCWNDNPEFERD